MNVHIAGVISSCFRLGSISIMRLSSLVRITESDQDQTSAVTLACQLLSDGNIIALPTDTIYGLAVCAQNTAAVRKLYGVKGRDSAKPVAVCVGAVDDISSWGKTDVLPAGLLNSLLPGPVTIILERTSLLNPELNPTCNKVGIRIPNHLFVRHISQKVAEPIALTSANLSNEPSCLSPKEFEPLWPQVAAVFDGGPLGCNQIAHSRAGSTVIDLSFMGKYHIVRDGSALVQTIATLHQFGLQPVQIAADKSIN